MLRNVLIMQRPGNMLDIMPNTSFLRIALFMQRSGSLNIFYFSLQTSILQIVMSLRRPGTLNTLKFMPEASILHVVDVLCPGCYVVRQPYPVHLSARDENASAAPHPRRRVDVSHFAFVLAFVLIIRLLLVEHIVHCVKLHM